MFLNPTELYELTGRKRRNAQVLALRHMGIEHRVRLDGSVVVLASHVEKVFDGAEAKTTRTAKRIEPDWSTVK